MPMTNPKHRGERSGFTLVELLVVVGIISVLIAILLPALNRVNATARSIKCAANLRQIGIGFQMYRNDYKNFLPPVQSFVSYNANGTQKSYGMWNAIGPYTGQKEWAGLNLPIGTTEGVLKWDSYWGSQKKVMRDSVWGCPENPDWACPWNYGYAESVYLQYPAGWGANNPRAWSFPRRASVIPDPSIRVHVSESKDWHLGKLADAGDPDGVWDTYRHLKGCNVLFLDGHVSYYKGADIARDITHATSSTSMDNFGLR